MGFLLGGRDVTSTRGYEMLTFQNPLVLPSPRILTNEEYRGLLADVLIQKYAGDFRMKFGDDFKSLKSHLQENLRSWYRNSYIEVDFTSSYKNEAFRVKTKFSVGDLEAKFSEILGGIVRHMVSGWTHLP
jgi:hypothetical protein